MRDERSLPLDLLGIKAGFTEFGGQAGGAGGFFGGVRRNSFVRGSKSRKVSLVFTSSNPNS
jgi:hypothetical protein